MNKKVPDKNSDEIEDWDDFEEVDLSQTRFYHSDDARAKISQRQKDYHKRNPFQFDKEKYGKIHNYKYDYSKVEYVNQKTQVIIICPIHGEFLQKPSLHRKYGCWKCANGKLIDTLSEEQKSEIYALVDDGISNYEITRRTGIKPFHIRKLKELRESKS